MIEKLKIKSRRSKVYVVLGPSGCGKGTQGELLADYLGVPFISMGAVLREGVGAQTPEGLKAATWMKKGMWVPDELVVKIIKKQLDFPENGFVLDSFPRVPSQVPLLDEYLKKRGLELKKVLHLVTSDKEAVWRIQKRMSEDQKKGKVREDETEEAIKARLSEYKRKVKPLLEVYRKKGILVEINNEPRDVRKIHREVIEKIA